MNEPEYRVHICHGPNCTPRGGAKALIETLEAAVQNLGIANRVEIIATSCRNRCELGPSVNVYPGPICYGYVTPEGMIRIAREHLRDGTPVDDLIVADASSTRFDPGKLDKLF